MDRWGNAAGSRAWELVMGAVLFICLFIYLFAEVCARGMYRVEIFRTTA